MGFHDFSPFLNNQRPQQCDNINDKKMIENAGLGVVMKGSTPVVTEVADYITDSNNDEGVAKILQKYYKNINF